VEQAVRNGLRVWRAGAGIKGSTVHGAIDAISFRAAVDRGADLIALLMAYRGEKLRRAALNASRGSIDDTEALSGIAE
jgi:hypothetical protein